MIQPPPRIHFSTRCQTALSEENKYSASGFGLRGFVNSIVSRSYSMSGNMGPKISSCIIGATKDTLSRTVGSIDSPARSTSPPMTTLSPHQAAQPFKMLFVDNARIVNYGTACILRIAMSNIMPQLFDKLGLCFCVPIHNRVQRRSDRHSYIFQILNALQQGQYQLFHRQ